MKKSLQIQAVGGRSRVQLRFLGSYKAVGPRASNGDPNHWDWGMVTNSQTGGVLDLGTANTFTIENYFRSFAIHQLVRNENINHWMNWKPTAGFRIEAEMFSQHNGVQMEVTTDTDGGFNVGHLDDNDWMTYSVFVPVAGTYILDFRVATPYTGGELLLGNQRGELARLAIPNTGGWQNWTTIRTQVNLPSGTHSFYIKSPIGGWNVNWWQIRQQ